MIFGQSLDYIWRALIVEALGRGSPSSPRGKPIKELLHQTIKVPLLRPIVLNPLRKINYKFMAAEALWILEGDNRLKPLTDVNPNMAKFSDDGETLAGAYGPRIASQLDYVVETLLMDRDSRQATLTIWDRNPRPSKDIPCTVAMSFNIRRNQLNMHVYMRSSDIWLGIPYDVFSFAMVAMMICGKLNDASKNQLAYHPVQPGKLYLTAMSSHLYDENRDAAREIVRESPARSYALVPRHLWETSRCILPVLRELAGSSKGDKIRWWESKA